MAPSAVAAPAPPGSARSYTLWPKHLLTICTFALGMAWAPVVHGEERPPIDNPAERVRTVDTKLIIRFLGKAAQIWDVESIPALTTIRVPEQIAVFRAMSSEKTYRVTLWEEVSAEFGTGEDKTQLWDTRILKVEDGAKLLFDASKCEVHKTAMRKELVPIAYGLRMSAPDAETRATKFPHAEHHVLGGCMPFDKTHSHIFICSDCEKAEQAHAK